MRLTTDIEIEVTHEDIRNGDRCFTEYCPIALAAKRAFSKVQEVTVLVVGPDAIQVSDSQDTHAIEFESYSMPLWARKFITDYDTGWTVSPFKFTIYR